MDKILANEEIRSLFTAMGTGFGAEFDVSKARYQKLVLMTDADVDGAHIRTLLLTLIYRYMKPILEAGYVYIKVWVKWMTTNCGKQPWIRNIA